VKTLEQLLTAVEKLLGYAEWAEEFPEKLVFVEADPTPARESKGAAMDLKEMIERALAEHQGALDQVPCDLLASLNQQTRRLASRIWDISKNHDEEAENNCGAWDYYHADGLAVEAEEHRRGAEELLYQLQTDQVTEGRPTDQEAISVTLPPQIMQAFRQQCGREGRSLDQAVKAAVLWFIEHQKRQEAEGRLRELESGGGLVYPAPLSDVIAQA